MFGVGEVLFEFVPAAASSPRLHRHPVTGRIGVVEAILRIQRPIAQALPYCPDGCRFIGPGAGPRIGVLDQRLPAPRPDWRREFVQEERVDTVMIDAIEPTETIRTGAVPI